jgi:hypothetical protein
MVGLLDDEADEELQPVLVEGRDVGDLLGVRGVPAAPLGVARLQGVVVLPGLGGPDRPPEDAGEAVEDLEEPACSPSSRSATRRAIRDGGFASPTRRTLPRSVGAGASGPGPPTRPNR